MKYIYTILSLALFTSCNMPAETKTDTGEPEGPHTSSEWQIWAYSTAAPDYIAACWDASWRHGRGQYHGWSFNESRCSARTMD